MLLFVNLFHVRLVLQIQFVNLKIFQFLERKCFDFYKIHGLQKLLYNATSYRYEHEYVTIKLGLYEMSRHVLS